MLQWLWALVTPATLWGASALQAPPPSLAPPPAEPLLAEGGRALAEYLTVVQPATYFDDGVIFFVNIDPARQSVVSCDCSMEVKVQLIKTESQCEERTLNMVVAEDPTGPDYVHWTVDEVNFTSSLDRPVDFYELGARNGSVSGGEIPMLFTATGLPESGEDPAYESRMLVVVTAENGTVVDADVKIFIQVNVLAMTDPSMTVWGSVPAGEFCSSAISPPPMPPSLPLPPAAPPSPPSAPPLPLAPPPPGSEISASLSAEAAASAHGTGA